MAVTPIQYKVPTKTPIPGGGTSVSYVLGDKDWANVRSVSVRQETGTGQVLETGLLEFKIRYRASLILSDQHKIVYEGKEYKILTIGRDKLELNYYLVKAKALGV